MQSLGIIQALHGIVSGAPELCLNEVIDGKLGIEDVLMLGQNLGLETQQT